MLQPDRSTTTLRRLPAALASATLTFVLSTPQATAGEGVIEINQTNALAGNVTSGDTPGFPVTISASGSYRLTSNLTLPPATATSVSAISVSVADVTIDLNGFTISGVAVCSGIGAGIGCTGTGTGAGILSTIARTNVHSGIVRAMSGRGIQLAGGRVWNVQVDGNGGDGIWSNGPVLIENSLVLRNFGDGVSAGSGSSISNVISIANGLDGIDVGDASLVRDGVSSQNGRSGFSLSGGSSVVDCVARSNGLVGVTGSGSTYRGCILSFNNGANTNPQSTLALPLADNYCGGDTICP